MRISQRGIPAPDPCPIDAASHRAGPTATSGDVVPLSASGRRIGGADGDRQERIEELRDRIGSGEYAVDYEALAERLVDDELLRAIGEG